MSSLYVSAPMSLDDFLAKAEAIGWEKSIDFDGSVILSGGRDAAHDVEAFDDASGAKRVMFERFGVNEIDDLVQTTGSISEHDDGFRAIVGIDDAPELAQAA